MKHIETTEVYGREKKENNSLDIVKNQCNMIIKHVQKKVNR